MALYAYQAFSREGKRISGSMDAVSVQEVRERLTRSGLLPVQINRMEQVAAWSFRSWLQNLFSARITQEDVIFFTKQLAVLLKAGVPLLQSLELLIEQTEKRLQRVVIELKDNIKEGKSLADGLAHYPAIFDTTYVQLVRAGEASGRLEIILDRLVDYLVRAQELRKKVRSAMTMPLIQLAVVVVVVIVILVVVIPQISGLFASQKVALPLPTRILIGLSDFVLNHLILLPLSILTSIALFFWWKSTEKGARLWDRMVLNIPIIGYFVRMKAVVQFCSTLGMLTEGGVNIAEALTIVCRIIDNRILVSTLEAARDKIIKQGNIATYLKETGLFPPVALYLIRTGEESGQLSQMLLTVATTYDTELRERADGLAEKLNPIMIIIMGGIVGFVVMAVGKPIMQFGDIASAGVKGFGSR